ncbi:MAG: response regulator transcription factor [Defluviitaleaceae bacterium]|nr:response regulator transcription factor [Defluviitaleaceae bacterium]MCL2262546.1 response regulator transcription factor [Defluviitaleaceae bacterium]
MNDKILICEDEENIVSFLKTELEFEGFAVEVAQDGAEAMAKFSAEFSLVLLDIMLPEKNGLECLREIRKTSNVPVIILTARKEVYDKVAFLTAGADDYVTKPFDTMELIARIKRHILRQKTAAQSPVPSGDLYINADAYRAEISGKDLHLTKTEFEILRYLHNNSGKVKTREEIIGAVFGDFYGESNIVDANVKNIRAKIARVSQAQIIETVRGKGYVIHHA